MPAFVDLSGSRFGRLTVIALRSMATKKPFVDTMWICRCDCGNESVVARGNLKNGNTASCGCLRNTQGGLSRKHKLWKRWDQMICRCSNPKNKDIKNYGARGISVCKRWKHFPSFLEDMEATFFAGATLERKDNDGNYEPNNVRWATPKEQRHNQRKKILLIDTPWGLMSRSDAAARAGVSTSIFISRLRCGWTQERLFAPENRCKLNRWSRSKAAA